ncbi:MAG: dockerin type I repeat-containing protein [Planctomycetota bacterium]
MCALGPGANQEVAVATYALDAATIGTSSLDFCDTLGVPPVPTGVIVGGAPVVPIQLSGNVLFLADSFIRGDVNGNGAFNLEDITFSLGYLFQSGSVPPCADAADVNDDGAINLTDAIYLANFFFAMGPTPAAPYPACLVDPTADALDCLVSPIGCP